VRVRTYEKRVTGMQPLGLKRGRRKRRENAVLIVPMYGYATPFSRRLCRPRPRFKSVY
jgi:hypothetical protein